MRIFAEDLNEEQRRDIEDAVARFDQREGATLAVGRNVLKVFGNMVVKQYRRPNLINKIAYSFFRKPKGYRAFIYPDRMKRAGVDSPRPLAYIDRRRWGFMSDSWFVCELCPDRRMFYEFEEKDITKAENAEVVRELIRLVAKMHEAGIYHRDLSPGNILWKRNADGKIDISIVDTNRMSFGKISPEKGVANFVRLWGTPEMFLFIAREYALQRGADVEKLTAILVHERKLYWRGRQKKTPKVRRPQ
ncbi:MAG: phosphotransferase [Muribaculaceae bacterium]|nr:phosphotransferase [Muribaculaceae bacterium]MCF0214051.1 phosphotransferase [Muribaculaceae bacterium]